VGLRKEKTLSYLIVHKKVKDGSTIGMKRGMEGNRLWVRDRNHGMEEDGTGGDPCKPFFELQRRDQRAARGAQKRRKIAWGKRTKKTAQHRKSQGREVPFHRSRQVRTIASFMVQWG